MDTIGRILVDGELAFDGVDVHLWVDDRAPLKSWRGSFTHENGWNVISKGSDYTLELEDGRSGEFVVSTMGKSAASPSTVFFVGSGPLA